MLGHLLQGLEPTKEHMNPPTLQCQFIIPDTVLVMVTLGEFQIQQREF